MFPRIDDADEFSFDPDEAELEAARWAELDATDEAVKLWLDPCDVAE